MTDRRTLGERVAALEERTEGHADTLKEHDSRLTALDRFKALLVGGAAVVSVLGTIFLDWLRKQFGLSS